jgi:replicative DNA helicase
MKPTRRAILGLTATVPCVVAGRGLFDNVQRAVQQARESVHLTGISTGLDELDRVTWGFEPGRLILIAAEPGIGKTAFATTVACHAAIRERIPVLYLSLSMTREELAVRVLASEGRIETTRMRRTSLEPDDHERLAAATARLKRAAIVVDDPPRPSMPEVRSRLDELQRRSRHQAGAKPSVLLVVDDIDGLGLPARSRSPAAMASMLGELVALTREKALATLLLWPLPWRDPEHLPTLADLGGYESFTDVVVFIKRDAVFRFPPDDRAELTVARNRSGPTGTIRVRFVRECGRFEDHPRSRGCSRPDRTG